MDALSPEWCATMRSSHELLVLVVSRDRPPLSCAQPAEVVFAIQPGAIDERLNLHRLRVRPHDPLEGLRSRGLVKSGRRRPDNRPGEQAHFHRVQVQSAIGLGSLADELEDPAGCIGLPVVLGGRAGEDAVDEVSGKPR
eukprot:3037966-Heterocapsa_arctica.AAC.2